MSETGLREAVVKGLKIATGVMAGDGCDCEQCDEIREFHVLATVEEYLRNRKPDGYAHQYGDGFIRFNGGEMVNGNTPRTCIPYYFENPSRKEEL